MLVGCSDLGRVCSRSLHVFAASSLTDALQEAAPALEAGDCTRTLHSFGASSLLRTQLELGAQADVFASADEIQMERARAGGLLEGEPVLFARNRLVVLTPTGPSPAASSLADLARAGVRLAAVDPSVPVGRYALRALDAMSRDPDFGLDFRDQVERNVVTREANVRQLVAKVALGEADAAIVYSSDARGAGWGRVIDIPDPFNVEAGYFIAVLREAHERELAWSYIDYLLSDAGQGILERHGFIRVSSRLRAP